MHSFRLTSNSLNFMGAKLDTYKNNLSVIMLNFY